MEELVKKVQECKEELKQAKTNEKYWTDMLKDKLEKQGIEKLQCPSIGLKVAYVDTTRSTMNEDKLINIIKKIADETEDLQVRYKILETIDYKPVINEEKLQELLYGSLLSTEDIESAMETKTYKTLRLGKMKGDK